MNPPTATGYSLQSIHTTRVSYQSGRESKDTPEERELGFRWDWRLEGARGFQVLLGAKVGPMRGRPDEMEAIVVGTFSVVGEVQSVDLRRFVSLNGPALLMPYLRQVLTNLSAQGPHGPFFLPPINVAVLSESFDMEASTGYPQLAAGETEEDHN